MNILAHVTLLALLVPGAAGAGARPQNTPASQAAALPVTSAAANRAMPEYRLGTGDKIRVEVYKQEQLSQSLQIRPDGKITLPFVGDIQAAGFTPEQLRDQISGALKTYVRDPVVTVMVVEALASTVYVMGEVNRPGTLPLTGPTTVLQVLAMAGGFRDFAKTSDIRILRNGPNGVETLHFNYKDAIKGEGRNLYLQRGDTVIVP